MVHTIKKKDEFPTLKSYAEIFNGEFRTKKKIYTVVDSEIFSYTDGKLEETWKKEDADKKIKSEVWGIY